ncbi:MAG: glucose PTS transporter subunit IIA, partial [Elusimicrobiota bacterium]|nr:glucose PTS transporter subunit IIA [Elusimicrobiota bacterium]
MDRDGFAVFSPVKGMLAPIEQAPDPVFAEKYMGDGVAIIPEDDNLYAPFSGIIKNINQNLHAVIMETDGIEILIHVGVDTVNLKGKGFKVFKKNGEKVEKGDKILEFDREFISKNAPSNMVIMVLVSPEAATLSKENSKRVNCGDYIFSVPANQNNKRKSESGAENAQDDKYISAEAEIYNQHGIHARPAAVIASIANKASSKVLIVKGKEEANAKNVIEIMGLNLAKGDKIKIVGYGSGAKNITEEILSEIKSGLNEKASVSSPPKVEGSAQDTTINLDMTKEQELSARPLVKGKVLGKTYLYVREEFTFEENSANKNKEKQILNAALEKTRTDMENIVNAAKNSSEKHILAAHLAILKDSSIFEVVNELIDEGKTTLFALNKAVENSACVLKRTNNPLLIERINDLMDVKRRLIEAVIGQDSIKDIPQNSIILAKDLLPSDIKVIEARAGGVILAEGSATSHSAIMLKNTGIPAVFGAGGGILKVKNGTDVLI